MKNSQELNKEISSFVLNFQHSFCEKYGVIPRVHYELEGKNCITLNDLDNIGNSLLNPRLYPEGIRTKNRRRELILVRQCIFTIAREMTISFEAIGDHFGFDHSTVIYSCNTIKNLLAIKNPDTVKTMKLINNGIKDKFGNDGVLQSYSKERVNT